MEFVYRRQAVGVVLLGTAARRAVKPSTWGEGAPKGADEGARFRIRSFFAGEFRRLRAASSFAYGGKGTKTPPGTRPMGYGFTLFRLGP